MGRAPCCDKANVKKGPWSPDEDAKLKAFIDQNGTGGNWITLPSKAGLKRCGKSCRLRWINYLRPDIKHGSFTEEEEMLIYKLHANIGSRWSLIAAQLPGRTDNDIKNYWNTRLKKKLGERTQVGAPRFKRSSPSRENIAIEKIDDGVMSLPLPSCKPTTLNGMSSSNQESILLQFMKPQFSELVDTTTILRDAAVSPMTLQQVPVVKSDVSVAVPEGNSVNQEEQLMRIEHSLMSCISSHPSPASSCSGISTDRSTYAPAGAQCAESSLTECLSSGYQDDQNNCIRDSDALLPVMRSAASPTLLVHSSVQAEVVRGSEVVPSSLERFRVDDGGLEDVMQSVLLVHDSPSQAHSKTLVGGGGGNVKAEDYNCSFDGNRYDVSWWSGLLVGAQQGAQQQKQSPRMLSAAAPKQQQHQQQHHYVPLQRGYGESMLPTQLTLDHSMQAMPSYMKPNSWSAAPSSCNGNASIGGSIAEYGQVRYGQVWDNVNWAETR